MDACERRIALHPKNEQVAVRRTLAAIPSTLALSRASVRFLGCSGRARWFPTAVPRALPNGSSRKTFAIDSSEAVSLRRFFRTLTRIFVRFFFVDASRLCAAADCEKFLRLRESAVTNCDTCEKQFLTLSTTTF